MLESGAGTPTSRRHSRASGNPLSFCKYSRFPQASAALLRLESGTLSLRGHRLPFLPVHIVCGNDSDQRTTQVIFLLTNLLNVRSETRTHRWNTEETWSDPNLVQFSPRMIAGAQPPRAPCVQPPLRVAGRRRPLSASVARPAHTPMRWPPVPRFQ